MHSQSNSYRTGAFKFSSRAAIVLCTAAAGFFFGRQALQSKSKTQTSTPHIALSPDLPTQVKFGSGSSLGDLQQDFDVFSWDSFIAANWPPGPNGEGDPSKKPGQNGDNPTVWESWIDTRNVLLPGGEVPSWGSTPAVPEVCRADYKPGMKVLRQIGKTSNLLTAQIQPFETGPLIDQEHQYARFEIHVNRSMFDFIKAHQLYSAAGQQKFSGDVSFPCSTANQLGAVMVKAAWKILSENDNPTRFHTADVLIYTPPSTDPPIEESCVAKKVGLVGLHIAHKVNQAPQWIWSTFEQVDNAPDETAVKNGKLASHYNFYKPNCTDCLPVDTAPPRPWNPNLPGQKPSQVVRKDALPPFAVASAKTNNRIAQHMLAKISKNSVWQYYELISTQWPTKPGSAATCSADPVARFGNPAPQFLANSSLETYVQGTVPNVSSSCISCHANAAMTTGKASDFTYVLQSAK